MTDRLYGIDGEDITDPADFAAYYEEPVQRYTSCLRIAFRETRNHLLAMGGILAASVGELYLTGIEVDGQYLTIDIGVSNLTDVRVEVDETDLTWKLLVGKGSVAR